jgi:hypothetical protein
MRIPADKLKSVVFLVQDGVPRATGFLTYVADTSEDPPVGFIYVVTARHCIEETKRRPFFVRINVEDRYDDIPTHADDWFVHEDADVAVLLWQGGPSPHYDLHLEGPIDQTFVRKDGTFPADSVDLGTAPEDKSLFRMMGEFESGAIQPREAIPVDVGHEVMFISLLWGHPGKQQNLPVARFGHISRLPREPVLIRSGASLLSIEAYLAECHSWGGHSGSPCFWLHPFTMFSEVPHSAKPDEVLLVPHERQIIALLGLVSGHTDVTAKAQTKTGPTDIVTRLNSGIAVVTPAEKIRELLMSFKVVSDRAEKARAYRRQKREESVVTSDFAPDESDGELTVGGFEQALWSATRITTSDESAPEG